MCLRIPGVIRIKENNYGFGNFYDDIVDFSEQLLGWDDLGLGNFGDSINVLNTGCNYNHSHQLFTTNNCCHNTHPEKIFGCF